LFSKLIKGFSTTQIILEIRLLIKAPDFQVPECEFFLSNKNPNLYTKKIKLNQLIF